MESNVSVASTTDTEQQVRAAMGMDDPTTSTETPPASTPVVPAAPVVATPETGEPADVTEPGVPHGRRKPTAKERIATLTARNTEAIEERLRAQAEVARLHGELEAIRTGRAPAPGAVPAGGNAPVEALGDKPKQVDFETVDEYLDARDAWLEKKLHLDAQQINQQATQASQQSVFEQEAMRQQQKIMATFEENVATTRAEIPDYDTVTKAANLAVSPSLRDYIIYEPNGPKVGYYLCKHVDEFDRIMQMGPGAQLTALGRLDAKLESGSLDLGIEAPVAEPAAARSAVSASVPAVARVSSAPSPVPRVSGGTAAAPAKLTTARTFKEFEAMRRQGVKH